MKGKLSGIPAEKLLIIYETEAKQWATYLQSAFTGQIPEDGICCYDVTTVSRKDDLLKLSRYACKLLILSKGMLEGLHQMRCFFLSRVLSPAACVVVLLCGVDSLTPLLDRVPINGDECLQISSEQDALEYVCNVMAIIQKGASAMATNVNPKTHSPSGSKQRNEQMQSSGADRVKSSVVIIPSRVPCGSSSEVFVLLKNSSPACNYDIEFKAERKIVRVKPVCWSEKILCVSTPVDFPAGNVRVTVYSGGKSLTSSTLQYYARIEELTHLLSSVADPVEFMCQALQVCSVDKLDQKLSSMLLELMPTGGFQGLQTESTHERGEVHHGDVPSLLHFAARYGFRSVSGLLLQCPGAERALRMANRLGQTPAEIAKSHGHKELHVMLKETLKMLGKVEDNSVYEMMCNASKQRQCEGEDEDPYTPFGMNDESNSNFKSEKAVNLTNRPPAPTPRPECMQLKEGRTPYIAQVFKKKKIPKEDADVYSLTSKQAQRQERSAPVTYDTFVPNQKHLEQLVEFQQRIKTSSLSMAQALNHISDQQQQQQVKKSAVNKQEKKLSHLRAGVINNRDDCVYDKINNVHHAPSFLVNESHRGSQPSESGFYTKPLKGQQGFWKADKR
ncbi:B-cell scaffold protein with ankyrin repeats-like [Anableps anableps]